MLAALSGRLSRPPRLLVANEPDKVLAFERDGRLYVFNFHPTASYTDYGVLVPPATSWRHLFDTDEPRYGGQGRIAPRQTFVPACVPDRGEIVQQIKLYLPSRTALVLGLHRSGSGKKGGSAHVDRC
jgi:1,4-alpha-glucan branching enzyme